MWLFNKITDRIEKMDDFGTIKIDGTEVRFILKFSFISQDSYLKLECKTEENAKRVIEVIYECVKNGYNMIFEEIDGIPTMKADIPKLECSYLTHDQMLERAEFIKRHIHKIKKSEEDG